MRIAPILPYFHSLYIELPDNCRQKIFECKPSQNIFQKICTFQELPDKNQKLPDKNQELSDKFCIFSFPVPLALAQTRFQLLNSRAPRRLT